MPTNDQIAADYLARCMSDDGRIRPLSEVMEAPARSQNAARYSQILAKQADEASKPELLKSLENVQQQYDDARRNGDTAKATFYRGQLELKKEEWAAEQAKVERDAAFSKDRRIELIREEADAIARSGAYLLPHSSSIDRDTLVAIARSSDYSDPSSQYRDFRELADRLSDENLAIERQKASDAEHEALKYKVDQANTNVRIAEMEQAKARREAE